MIKSLKRCYLFKGLSNQELINILNTIGYSILQYQENDTVLSEHNFTAKLGIIIAGEINAIKNHYSGKLINLNTLRVGNLLGISAIFNDKSYYPSELKATKKSKVIFINQNELMRLFKLNDTVLKNYLCYISNRINFLNNKIEVFTYNNIEDRVLHFLRIRFVNEDVPVDLRMTKTDMANYLAISRSSLYRVLDNLQSKGYVVLKNGAIYLKI